MMLKFLKHGTGDGREASKYVLETSKSFEKEVLFGSGEIFDAVTNSLEFVHRYRSAVISWSLEDQPTPNQIKETLDKFFDIAFAGLDRDRFSPLAVLHTGEDGRKDMHILIPRVDLETGKSYNPAPPGWQKLYDPFRDMMNYAHDWTRPDDEQRKKELSLGKPEKFDRKNGKDQIHEWLKERIDHGLVKNRADVLVSLGEIGEVTRAGKDYVSVKLPDFDKPLRLKGGIYEQQFDAVIGRKIETENFGRCGVDRAEQRRRFESAQRSFTEVVERVSAFNQRKYAVNFDRVAERTQESEQAINSPTLAPVLDHLSSDRVDVSRDLGYNEISDRQNNALSSDNRSERDRNTETERRLQDNTRSIRADESRVTAVTTEEEKVNDTDRTAVDAIFATFARITAETERIAERAKRITTKTVEWFSEHITARTETTAELATAGTQLERASDRFKLENQQVISNIAITVEQQQPKVTQVTKQVARSRGAGISM